MDRVTRKGIELILDIEQERELFFDGDFWMTPEENHRLRALKCKPKADIGDTIAMHILEGSSIEYELQKLEEMITVTGV